MCWFNDFQFNEIINLGLFKRSFIEMWSIRRQAKGLHVVTEEFDTLFFEIIMTKMYISHRLKFEQQEHQLDMISWFLNI